MPWVFDAVLTLLWGDAERLGQEATRGRRPPRAGHRSSQSGAFFVFCIYFQSRFLCVTRGLVSGVQSWSQPLSLWEPVGMAGGGEWGAKSRGPGSALHLTDARRTAVLHRVGFGRTLISQLKT